jgi:hypothetical protein
MLSTTKCQGMSEKPWEETVLCDTGCTTCDEADAAEVPLLLLNCNQKKKGEIDYKDGENVTWSKPLITTNAHHTFISSQYFTTEDILE